MYALCVQEPEDLRLVLKVNRAAKGAQEQRQ